MQNTTLLKQAHVQKLLKSTPRPSNYQITQDLVKHFKSGMSHRKLVRLTEDFEKGVDIAKADYRRPNTKPESRFTPSTKPSRRQNSQRQSSVQVTGNSTVSLSPKLRAAIGIVGRLAREENFGFIHLGLSGNETKVRAIQINKLRDQIATNNG